MPGFDRTGPQGLGSKSGRGLGKCNPNNQDSDNQVNSEQPRRMGKGFRGNFGRGFGQGQARGRGMERGRM